MNYSKYSQRELRSLLSAASDTATVADITSALEAIQASREASSKVAFIAPKKKVLYGAITVISKGVINTKIAVLSKDGKKLIWTELSPAQLAVAGGLLEKGDIVSVQTEIVKGGVSQYKENGNIQTHKGELGVKYTNYGLVTILTPKEITNIYDRL